MVGLKFYYLVGILSAIALSAQAAEAEDVLLDKASLDSDVISVYGKDCEKIKSGEARSTVRVRVTDKASYLAVSSLPDLKNAHIELNDHDFNVMVYNLVDNSIEDMAIRTTKQTPEEICVEVTGYISGKNIFAAIDEALNRQKTASEENIAEENEEDTAADIAPQPPTEENQSQSDNMQTKPLSSEDAVIAQPTVYAPEIEDIPNSPATTSAPKEKAPSEDDYLEAKASSKGLIYISPTEFFNQTTSSKYSEILREMFVKSDYFYITDKKELADFVITPKVLRAKVDPINSETNRLQMVIAVECFNPDTQETETEHQNRFVLFNSSENEQQVAAKLMKQLFEKASDKIITELEIKQRKKNNDAGLPSVITPVSSSPTKMGAL